MYSFMTSQLKTCKVFVITMINLFSCMLTNHYALQVFVEVKKSDFLGKTH